MLNNLEKQIVKELQNGLPLVSRPYLEIANRIGILEDELISKINEMIKRGIIRRFGAALRHQDLGFTANAMVVWEVPEEQAPSVGKAMAGFNEVTHCYQRTRHPSWPYSIFTVIHGPTKEHCERVAASIARKTGISNYKLVFSTKELKKSSMKYFMD